MNNNIVAAEKLHEFIKPDGPGIQYTAVNGNTVIFEYAGGLADIKRQIPVSRNTTMAAFSMTKILTAIAILQLVDSQKIRIEDLAGQYIDNPFDINITVKQLLNHTSGIPNPLPLRWTHLPAEINFDEGCALKNVLEKNHTNIDSPGKKYKYSNIGYWLLGRIIENITKEKYPEYIRKHILDPLNIKSDELDFAIIHPENHAKGYLEKYSFMNLVKGFLLADSAWGEYEGYWLHINDVYLNGPSFGGAIGYASAFGRILQDLLCVHSVLISDATRKLLFLQSQNSANEKIGMSLGWHIGDLYGIKYFYKEGGGAGFHSEMRIYPDKGVGSVVMSNQTSFNPTKFLNHIDAEFV